VTKEGRGREKGKLSNKQARGEKGQKKPPTPARVERDVVPWGTKHLIEKKI